MKGLWAATLACLLYATHAYANALSPDTARSIASALKKHGIEVSGVSVSTNTAIVCEKEGCYELSVTSGTEKCGGITAGSWCIVTVSRPREELIAALSEVEPVVTSWSSQEFKKLERFPSLPNEQGTITCNLGGLEPLFRSVEEEFAPGWKWSRTNIPFVSWPAMSCQTLLMGPGLSVPLFITSRPFGADELACAYLTRYTCINTVGEVSSGADEALKAFVRTVIRAERWFFPSMSAKVTMLWRLALIIMFIWLTIRTVAELIRVARPSSYVLSGLVLLSLLAFLLRFLLSPWNFLHEFHYVAPSFEALVNPTPTIYGETVPALFFAAETAFGGCERAMFATNAVLATLTVLATTLLCFGLSKDWKMAFLAGLILCCLPQHLRFSSSEVLQVSTTLFAVWTAGMLLLYERQPSNSNMLAVVVAATLTIHSRPEAVVVLGMCLLLVIVLKKENWWRFLMERRSLIAVSLMVASFVWGRLLAPQRELNQRFLEGGWPILKQVWFDTEVTPPTVLLLWIIGLYSGWRTGRWRTMWLISTAFLYATAPLLMFENPVFNQRSQLPATPFHAIIAAQALSLFRQDRFFQMVKMLACVALACVGLITHSKYVISATATQEEWNFIKATLPTLPEKPHHFLLARTGPGVLGFPSDMAWCTEKLINPINLDTLGDEVSFSGNTYVAYFGLECYECREEECPPLHPSCDKIRKKFELRPISVKTIVADPEPKAPQRRPKDGFVVGFYEVLGARDIQ